MKPCLVLLVLAAVAARVESGKIQAEAIATATVSKNEAKGRYRIELDGSQSTPSHTGCLLYKWYVWVKESRDNKYWDPIGRGPRKNWAIERDCTSYKFKLEVYDRDGKYLNDSTEFKVKVDIDCDNGDVSPPDCKNTDPLAVAEIISITSLGGQDYSVELDASKSEHCDNLIWRYDPDGEDWESDKEKPSHGVNGPGYHKFLLECVNNCKKRTRIDKTSVVAFVKDCDPCEEVQAHAHVSSSSNCNFYLDASNSDNCDSYEWRVKINGGSQEFLSNKKKYSFDAKTHGDFKFILYCRTNDGCESKDTEEASCGDPCDEMEMKADITLDKVTSNDGGDTYLVELSARDSDNCNKYEWFRLKKEEWKPIGTTKNIDFLAYHNAEYKFKLKCWNSDVECDPVKTTLKTSCLSKELRRLANN